MSRVVGEDQTTSSGVSDINTTTVVDPEVNKTVHSFDRTFTWKENAEVKTQIYHGSSTLLRTIDRSYTAGASLGNVGMTVDDNRWAAQQPRALSHQ